MAVSTACSEGDANDRSGMLGIEERGPESVGSGTRGGLGWRGAGTMGRCCVEVVVGYWAVADFDPVPFGCEGVRRKATSDHRKSDGSNHIPTTRRCQRTMIFGSPGWRQ